MLWGGGAARLRYLTAQQVICWCHPVAQELLLLALGVAVVGARPRSPVAAARAQMRLQQQQRVPARCTKGTA
jgi:hypothetical protein